MYYITISLNIRNILYQLQVTSYDHRVHVNVQPFAYVLKLVTHTKYISPKYN